MNNTFNAQRFGLLFKKTLLERPMQLFGLAGLSITTVFFSYVICKELAGFDVAQNASFLLGLVGGGCFLASFVYGYFATNAMGSSFLTLPASHFEKWLCGVIITGLLYTILFFLIYRLIDTVFVGIYHRSLDPGGPFYKELYEQVQIFPFDGFVANKGEVMYANFAGAMLVGSLYFNRVSFIKVALLIFAVWFGAWLLNLMISKAMIQDTQNAMPYYLVWISVDKETGRIELPGNIATAIKILIQYIIPAILWMLAWLRLREKEF
jgi:predicted neutral ceramidase superfamily lipid hydrolase